MENFNDWNWSSLVTNILATVLAALVLRALNFLSLIRTDLSELKDRLLGLEKWTVAHEKIDAERFAGVHDDITNLSNRPSISHAQFQELRGYVSDRYHTLSNEVQELVNKVLNLEYRTGIRTVLGDEPDDKPDKPRPRK